MCSTRTRSPMGLILTLAMMVEFRVEGWSCIEQSAPAAMNAASA
jgi:hypothetical protein